MKKYDHNLSALPLKDRILLIKKSFLNKEFTNFFNIHRTINKNNIAEEELLTQSTRESGAVSSVQESE